MDWHLALATILGGYVALLILRVPIFFAFLIVVLVSALAIFPTWIGVIIVARNVVDGLLNFVLLPIPLFLLIGNLIVESGVGARAVQTIARRVDQVGGRTGFVALGSGALLSFVSGSSLAAAALILRTLDPIYGSSKKQQATMTGAALSSGGIAIFVPPSALAVLVSSIANVNVSDFLISIVPVALAMTLLYALIILTTEEPGSKAGQDHSIELEVMPIWPIVVRFGGLFGVMMLGIVLGFATPTEAAALGVAVTVIHLSLTKELTFAGLYKSLVQTVSDSTSLLLIVAMAGVFSQMLVFLGIADGVRIFLTDMNGNTLLLLLFCAICALLLGCFIDGVSLALVCIPLFLPALTEAGVSPIYFCLMLLLCIETGLLTPPFGLLLIVAGGLVKSTLSTSEIIRPTLPFLGANIALLISICIIASVFVK